jgi:flagellar biosynthesis protein FliR
MGLLQLYLDQFLVYILVLTRVSGLVLTAPFFGSRSVPIRIRAFLAIGLSLIVAPLQGNPAVAVPSDWFHLALMLGREALLGLSLGLAVMIVFTGLQLTGQIIGQMGGVSLAEVIDPTFEDSVPVFAQLLDIVTLSVFVAIGGHRHVLGALLDTFRNRPPGIDDIPPSLMPALTQIVSESFVVGFRAAAPVMLALLLAAVILGLISRTLPQLNVIAVGFSINVLIMLAVLSVCLGAMVDVVCVSTNDMIETIHRVWVNK